MNPALVALAALVLAACSSKSRAVEDAKSAQVHEAPRDAAAGPAKPDSSGKHGDVQIRVEWHDVPMVARASPGATPCATPRTPLAAPTTTWGVPDAVVMIDVAGTAPVRGPRVTLDHCALAPKIVVAGTEVEIASAMDGPQKLVLDPTASVRPLGGLLPELSKHLQIPVQLPAIGHAVVATLGADTIYTLATNPGGEQATIVAASTPFVAITEPTGQVVLRDVPVGSYAVSAYLPPRGGQPGRRGEGKVTVAADALAEVTIELAASP